MPLPLPLAPLVTVSHDAVLAAVQAQPAGLVTADALRFTGRHGASPSRGLIA